MWHLANQLACYTINHMTPHATACNIRYTQVYNLVRSITRNIKHFYTEYVN